MHFLPAVIMFAIILTILAGAMGTQSYETSILHMVTTKYTASKNKDWAKKLHSHALKEFRRQNPDPQDRDKNRSYRLNLSALVQDANGMTKRENQREVVQKIFIHLLYYLYGNTSICDDLDGNDATLFDKLSKEIFIRGRPEPGEPPFLDKKEALGNVDLQDPLLQKLLFRILKGDGSKNKINSSAPSLLPYICFKNNPFLVSIWNAPQPILEAIFQNHNTVMNICDQTSQYHLALIEEKDATKQQTLRTEIEIKLRDTFGPQLSTEIKPEWIDFKPSKTRPLHGVMEDDEDDENDVADLPQ